MKQYTGKTLDDVLAAIASENECKVEDITYNVVKEEKHFLGIGNSVTVEAYTPADVKEFIFNYLGSYFVELNQPVAIEVITDYNQENNSYSYRTILDADNNAIIIGKGGQTLRAISTVLRAAVNATFKKRINVTLDVNHYKEDRYKKIKSLAEREAKRVVRSHIDAHLDPMPNDERKVIHQYLQDFKNVSTVSIGEGNARHLIIKYTPESDD